MIKMPERYLTNSASSDLNAVTNGFLKIIKLCASHSHNAVILHLPSKKHVSQLSKLLGQATVRKLNKDNYATWNSLNLTLNTERLDITNWTEDIIFSLYPKSKMTDNLNDLKRAKAIVIVPWTDKDREEWIKTWNPELIGAAQENVDSVDLDPRLERALVALTHMINLSTGLTHSSDRESAIQLLRILHQKRIQLDPDNMRIWALQHDWTSNGANALRDLAQGVLEGRGYRIGRVKIWNEEYIQNLLEDL